MLFATGNVVIHRALPSLAGIGGVFGSFKNISNFLDEVVIISSLIALLHFLL